MIFIKEIINLVDYIVKKREFLKVSLQRQIGYLKILVQYCLFTHIPIL
jgi:hypothetical protein